jgi:hypothetical protein
MFSLFISSVSSLRFSCCFVLVAFLIVESMGGFVIIDLSLFSLSFV